MLSSIFPHGQLLSLESAAEDEHNLVLYIRHQRAAESFLRLLWDRQESIAALVRYHLNLRNRDRCVILPPKLWIRGGCNLCVLVEVHITGRSNRLVFRCPMPHKLAERQYPGTIDEKVRGEVATYVWMGEHCPQVFEFRVYTPSVSSMEVRLVLLLAHFVCSSGSHPSSGSSSRTSSNVPTTCASFCISDDGCIES